MSIDRTDYNALVDDDGTGTIGTQWAKANVGDILDAIDLLLANRVAVSYSAGNFTTDTGTWTVASGDQVTYSYQVTNKQMVLHIVLANTTVATSPTALRVAIPGGFAAAVEVDGSYTYKDNATKGTGLWQVLASGTYVAFMLNNYGTAWGASTDATDIRATVIIPLV